MMAQQEAKKVMERPMTKIKLLSAVELVGERPDGSQRILLSFDDLSTEEMELTLGISCDHLVGRLISLAQQVLEGGT